jgi:hypothetical protein
LLQHIFKLYSDFAEKESLALKSQALANKKRHRVTMPFS